MPDEAGLLSAELWDLGTTGIEETAAGLRVYFEDTTNPETIQRRFANFDVTIEPDVAPVFVQEDAERDPIFVGTRFVIVPVRLAETQRVVTPGRIVLPIDAAMAFGSGRHETTQLCLQALEQLVKSGHTVFDIGCGSGILSLAALKLGASFVVAADIDEPAIAVARQHFPGSLFAGSADGFPAHAADLVICNITGQVDDHLAFNLQRITKPAGQVILSGFTVQTAPQNFKAEQILSNGDWQCWICNPDCISPSTQIAELDHHEPKWWL